MTLSFPLRVFYDGSCAICAAEIGHYCRQDRRGRLLAVDISAPDFDPAPFGLPLAAFFHELQVIDHQGERYRGVEAFWAIWQAFPEQRGYRLLARVIHWPLVLPLARLLYWAFARSRRYLPKRRSGCSDGSCRLGRH